MASSASLMDDQFASTMVISRSPKATLSVFKTVDGNVDRFIAAGPWVPLDKDELHHVQTTGFLGERGIVLTAVTDAFYSDFYKNVYPLLGRKSAEEVQGIQAFLSETRRHIAGTLGFPVDVSQIENGDLVLNPPNVPSTAFDYDRGFCIGMHIDDHQKLPFDNRTAGFQLLNINLGLAERYLCFVNYSFLQLLEKVRSKTNVPIHTARELKNLFFTYFPEEPIYRITLKPRDAYIAVTQNFIHDGNTNLENKLDISFLVGGRFLV